MGAHRLWSHRAFKAKTPLRIFLLWLHTLAGQVKSTPIALSTLKTVLFCSHIEQSMFDSLFLMAWNGFLFSSQNCLYVWVRDHRQHHKYSDTDADPHNANRGFFFSHVGWLMSKKHPKVKEYGKKIDMSDLEADRYIMFQKEWVNFRLCSFPTQKKTARNLE